MTVSKIFINGCSFLTFRPRDNVNTHCGIELAKLMQLAVEVNLAGGGRGSKRLMWTTRAWCEKFPDKAKDCFFLIGSSGGHRFDYPTNDGYKAHKFPSMKTTWKTWDPNRDDETRRFFKYLFKSGADLDQMTQVESILTLLDLQDYFTNKGYPYVFYNTLSDAKITNPDIQLMFDKINKKRFFKPETSHLDYTREKSQQCKPDDEHPNEEGHRDWANQLKEFIDANDLRTI
jgi:hypothetical protein|tara:strand:- start:2921 stop:3613 length:693 start_codon:yes stop_codon:yes gene_type:complete